MFEKLKALLNLPETATEEDVLAKIKALMEGSNKQDTPIACKEVFHALGLPESSDKSHVVATIYSMKHTLDHLEGLKNLQNEITETASEQIVAKAIAEGKVTPAMKQWAMDYAKNDPRGFGIYVAKTPPIIPMERLSPLSKNPSGINKTDTQAKIEALLDI